MNVLGVIISSSHLLYALLTDRRQAAVEKRREYTSTFTEVIVISSDEERYSFLSALAQSVCKVLTVSSTSALLSQPKNNGEIQNKKY